MRWIGNALIVIGSLVLAVGGGFFINALILNQTRLGPVTSLAESVMTGASQAPLAVETLAVPGATSVARPSPTPTTRRATRVPITPPPGVPSRLLGNSTLPALLPTRSLSPVRLVIPQIGVDTRVIEVGWQTVDADQGTTVEWETAAYAAGHQVDTPGVGQRGNMVITGHNNIYGEVFRNLSDVTVGAEMAVYSASGVQFRYRVSEVLIVREADATPEERAAHARYLDPTRDITLTLISCYPYTSDTHRVIVVAKGQP